MAALHPHEYVYFNGLTDTRTPGALARRYDMDYWRMSRLQSLEYLLARYPDDTLRAHTRTFSDLILPQDDRERIVRTRNLNSADYHIQRKKLPDEPMIHGIEAYGSGISYISAPKNSEAYRAAHEDAATGTLLTRSAFDIYAHNGELRYLNADCEPLRANGLDLLLFLHIFPADPADLPADGRERGFESRVFRLNKDASFFDGKCIVRQALPSYPIARIATGYEGGGGVEWRVDIDLAAQAAQALYAGIAAGEYGRLAAQADFDVYLRAAALTYIKENCDQSDADARFLLHIIPANPADLPADSRDYGFENLNFRFADHGARIGGICVASRQLPAYPIDRIRAGQFVSGGGAIWQVEFAAAR